MKSAGYQFLIKKMGIPVIENWHRSFVGDTGYSRHTVYEDGSVEDTYPARNWPGDTIPEHLEFAIKYDGINLSLLTLIFKKAERAELADFIKDKPISSPRRRLWFLYEFLTGESLDLPDLTKGNYIELLGDKSWFTRLEGERSKRHRVVNNLPGTVDFCPLVRRTKKLAAVDSIEFSEECQRLLRDYSPQLLKRALGYLYTKETKSSFEIEHLKPSPSRTEKFIALLALAETKDFCNADALISLQNMIVDPRFADSTYRSTQNYVGQTVTFQKEVVHYVCPRPDDVPSLMNGLIEAHQIMREGNIPALIHAAVIAYSFVFIHPFDDGNGRIHRFLLHNILALQGFTPKGLMLPISAAMLKDPLRYDQSLEAFSTPLLQVVEYELNDLGEMAVQNETGFWYRYMDMTAQAEALLDFVRKTITNELANELEFLAKYDATKEAIQEIIDLPDRQIDLFINLCVQNNGSLSPKKRENHFSLLTDEELDAMTMAVKTHFIKDE